MSLEKKVSKLARWVRSGANRLRGLSSSSEPAVLTEGNYYPQVRSCQIQNLDTLLCLFLGKKPDGYFVEVGAYDGFSFSNTWGLAERGWSGLLIEPCPDFAKLCAKNHASHSRVRTVNVACSDGSSATIELSMAGALTTGNAEVFDEYAHVPWAQGSLSETKLVVSAMKLDEVLHRENVSSNFDLLVVDVEGMEASVFAGFSVSLWRPQMIIVELADVHPDLTAVRTNAFAVGKDLTDAGYRIVYKDAINTVLVREDVCHAAYS